eukprot:662610-Hanusia_phi.AAC.1
MEFPTPDTSAAPSAASVVCCPPARLAPARPLRIAPLDPVLVPGSAIPLLGYRLTTRRFSSSSSTSFVTVSSQRRSWQCQGPEGKLYKPTFREKLSG